MSDTSTSSSSGADSLSLHVSGTTARPSFGNIALLKFDGSKEAFPVWKRIMLWLDLNDMREPIDKPLPGAIKREKSEQAKQEGGD
jgi:hypothetical protein